MPAAAQLLLSALSKQVVGPATQPGPVPAAAPGPGPLTSEPPLADATPLTSEAPLAVIAPLTSEPATSGGAWGMEFPGV